MRRWVLKEKGRESTGKERMASVEQTKYGRVRGREIRKSALHVVQILHKALLLCFSSLPGAAFKWAAQGESSGVINFKSMPDCLGTKF